MLNFQGKFELSHRVVYTIYAMAKSKFAAKYTTVNIVYDSV